MQVAAAERGIEQTKKKLAAVGTAGQKRKRAVLSPRDSNLPEEGAVGGMGARDRDGPVKFATPEKSVRPQSALDTSTEESLSLLFSP
jgi:hypothetical protein